MTTIKVIDLLNKIANGEEVPEKIEYGDFIYERIKRLDNTYNYKNSEGNFFEDDWFLTNMLDKEVKIIKDTSKEDKKIKRLNVDIFQCVSNLEAAGQNANYFEYGFENEILDIVDKINEIINKVNGEDND